MNNLEIIKKQYKDSLVKSNWMIIQYELLLDYKVKWYCNIFFHVFHRKKFIRKLKNHQKKCEVIKKDFLKYNREFKSEYASKIVSLGEKRENEITNYNILEIQGLYSYVEGSRIHLDLHRDYENQLRYKTEQIDNQKSMYWAYFSIIATCVFSIVSIVLSLKSWCDNKNTEANIINKIQTTTDTIRYRTDGIYNKLDSIIYIQNQPLKSFKSK